MEFKEFSNPEENDYDISSSLKDSEVLANNGSNSYAEQLMDMIGFIEDFDDDLVMEKYGITFEEYLKPTADTIRKVTEKMNSSESKLHR